MTSFEMKKDLLVFVCYTESLKKWRYTGGSASAFCHRAGDKIEKNEMGWAFGAYG